MEISYLGAGGIKISGRSVSVVCDSAGRAVVGTMEIVGPGEYEVQGSLITGVAVGEGTVYAIEMAGIRAGILTGLNRALSNEQVESLGPIDVLVVPISGQPTVVTELISQLEPKYVVPIDYDDSKLAAFLKEMGSSPEPVAKLKLSSKELPLETTVVVLQQAS